MRKTKNTIVNEGRPRAEIPEIFVKTTNAMRAEYARAHLRVKGGKYVYLAWKDGDRVRNFYLGQKRNRALPTSGARAGDRGRRRADQVSISVGQNGKKSKR
jgi:hypothetical protein